MIALLRNIKLSEKKSTYRVSILNGVVRKCSPRKSSGVERRVWTMHWVLGH